MYIQIRTYWENRNKKQTYAVVATVAAKYPNVKSKHKILGIDQNNQIKRPCLVAIAAGNSFYRFNVVANMSVGNREPLSEAH